MVRLIFVQVDRVFWSDNWLDLFTLTSQATFWVVIFIMPKFVMPVIIHQTASLNASAPGVLSTWSAAGSGGSRHSATGELRSTVTSVVRRQITKSFCVKDDALFLRNSCWRCTGSFNIWREEGISLIWEGISLEAKSLNKNFMCLDTTNCQLCFNIIGRINVIICRLHQRNCLLDWTM